MNISQEEFEKQFREAHHLLLKAMAEHPDIHLDRFYSMACFLENLSYMGPVIFELIKKAPEKRSE